VSSHYLVGALMCPLWKGEDRWKPLKGYPEREPVIGWYDESDPKTTEFEIQTCLAHGISFFAVCWFRDKSNLGKSPIQTRFGHWTDGALPRAKSRNKFRYALLWENLNDIACGVADETDFLENLLPHWISQHFKKKTYLKVDNKPVLFLHGPEKLIAELGGTEKAAATLEKARALCQKAGFAGLTVLGQNCSKMAPDANTSLKALGLDYSFAYHWPTFASAPFMVPGLTPDPKRMVAGQALAWKNQAAGALPNILTASIGWDSRPWGGSSSPVRWKLSPEQWQLLLEWAKTELDSRAATSPGLESQMLLLDNWNEYGEGHYLFPTKGDGYTYLDALRNVFPVSGEAHRDAFPERPQAMTEPARNSQR